MYGECLKAQADRWVSIGKLCDKEIIASNLDDAVSVLKDHMRDLSNKLGSRVIVVVALVVIKSLGEIGLPGGEGLALGPGGGPGPGPGTGQGSPGEIRTPGRMVGGQRRWQQQREEG